MLVFLCLNEIELTYRQDELIDIILMVASSKKTYENLLDWIIEHQN